MQRTSHVILALLLATGVAAAGDPKPGSGSGTGSGSGSIKVDKVDTPRPVDPDAPVTWTPVRWQAPDGTTVTLTIEAKRDQAPKLEVKTLDESYELALKGAFKQMVPAFVAIGDELVITTGATPGLAWRFTWRKGRFVQTKSVYWATDKKRPAWAVDAPATTPDAALRRIAGLLRLGGTVGGIDRFFADAPVTWNVYTRGDPEPWKRTMTGKEVLARWVGAGWPIVRGTLKIAKSCLTLPANATSKPAAPAAPPDAPALQTICVDKDLHVTAIDTLIAPQPEGTKPSAVMP
jgi:hypothetical protein